MRALVRSLLGICLVSCADATAAQIGHERSTYQRLPAGEELTMSIRELISAGEATFRAEFVPQEGGGRPLSKGTGSSLADSSRPLLFPHNFNRVTAMDANSCAGCHNQPFGRPGGGGDFVTGVFVAAQRFDFGTFDLHDGSPTRGVVDESGGLTTLQTIGNYRATIGMFGSGFIEMLARQMTVELQSTRDSLEPGESARLETKGVSFGTLRRDANGGWDVADVEGLPPQSIATDGGIRAPTLIIRPFHQSGSVVSLREFTNNALNHHHGMQSTERFGVNADPDGDGVYDELTTADITAVTLFQATLPVPGQVLPRDPYARRAVADGTRLFEAIGCVDCHRPTLPLTDEGWIFTEPSPFNPPGNLQRTSGITISVDLTDESLPGPRLQPHQGVVLVPAFTDLKLHDITRGVDDPNVEPLDINQPAGTAAFFAGNRYFLTKKLWGAANERPYFHHGLYTTLREAIQAHYGEASEVRERFDHLGVDDQNRIIEFLKTLQVLPERSRADR